MVSMERMLFATDFSEQSLAVLSFLSDFVEIGVKKTGIIFVVNIAKFGVASGFDVSAYIESELEKAEKKLPEIAENFEAAGIKAEILEVPTGNPVVEITKEAQKYDFISIGSRGRSLFKEVLLGSVSEGVLRRSKVPVYVFKFKTEFVEGKLRCYKTCERLFEKILVAYDFSEHAEKALEYAKYVAKKANSEILLLHVEEEEENCRMHDLSPMAGKLRNEGYRVVDVLVPGTPTKTILRKSKEFGATTIFAGSRGLSLPASFLLGSVSDSVVRRSEVPVMVCR